MSTVRPEIQVWSKNKKKETNKQTNKTAEYAARSHNEGKHPTSLKFPTKCPFLLLANILQLREQFVSAAECTHKDSVGAVNTVQCDMAVYEYCDCHMTDVRDSWCIGACRYHWAWVAHVWQRSFWLRTALFWVVTRPVVVITCWRFGTAYWSHLQGFQGGKLER